MEEQISKELLQYIQTSIEITSYEYKEENYQTIVPNDFTHEFLLKDCQIDDSIKRYYFQTSLNLQDNRSRQFLNKKLVHGWEYNLLPYSTVFHKAYYKRSNLYFSLLPFINKSKDNPKLENAEIETLHDLKPYFEEYSKGFRKGYDNFEEDKIKKYLNEYSTKKDFSNKVFEFLTIYNSDKGWLSSHGFTYNFLDNKNITGGFENGKTEGYYYKAWSIVFSSSYLYKPLFKNYYWNSKKAEICHKLIGRTNGENTAKTSQPVYHYIKDILKE